MIVSMWKHFKLKTKLGIAFGTILILLAAVSTWALFGINDIVGNANKVIEGNKLHRTLTQKEVDHLIWVRSVNSLLTDVNKHHLRAETDHTKCGLGTWLFSPARDFAEVLVPKLQKTLQELEGTHKDLHQSAKMIAEAYQETNLELSNLLQAARADHLVWTYKIKDIFFDSFSPTLRGETIPKNCSLGKWLRSSSTQKYANNDQEFKELWSVLEKQHDKLHKNAEELRESFQVDTTEKSAHLYTTTITALSTEILGTIDSISKWNHRHIVGYQKAQNIYSISLLPALEKTSSLLLDLKTIAKDNLITDRQMLEAANKTKLGVISFSLIAFFIGGGAAFTVAQGIIIPIQNGAKFAEQVAAGDLTAKVNINQRDEIGDMVKALNSMADKLREMFGNISVGINTLTSSSAELSAISKHMAGNSSQTSNRSNQVAAATEQMSINMDSVAASSEKASTNVQVVAVATEQMTATINEIVENTEKSRAISKSAVQQAVKASGSIKELGDAAANIGKVTETINEISDQTNLLALNVTIEAARAGDAGKGFAVVANEIKELANKTADATFDIKNRIEGMQKNTSVAVSEIQEIESVINDINQIVSSISSAVKEQSASTQEIANSIVQAAQGIQDVSENISQNSVVTGEIAKDILEVNQATNEIAAGSNEVNVGARELSVLAKQLNILVAQFRI